jgi:hypothetical protein
LKPQAEGRCRFAAERKRGIRCQIRFANPLPASVREPMLRTHVANPCREPMLRTHVANPIREPTVFAAKRHRCIAWGFNPRPSTTPPKQAPSGRRGTTRGQRQHQRRSRIFEVAICDLKGQPRRSAISALRIHRARRVYGRRVIELTAPNRGLVTQDRRTQESFCHAGVCKLKVAFCSVSV